MSRPSLTETNSIEELAAWAASNHQGGFMPSDWMPLLLQAQVLALRELRSSIGSTKESPQIGESQTEAGA